ncbi:hypothetical protein [Thermosyntropha sp.]|uniref:hypothetical protein n=1 Tax=Thermosyntropha sp. TaxID=2740820 RepID=UPI0025F06F3D|nr:hypothetical protein [Thermosyntropha sp.]MBO8159607.1 hypothetical protein [Thermosyntropha sp.]
MKKELLELLESLENYVPKLINASSDMAENIQSGNEGKAFLILKDYIEGIMWTVEAIDTIKSLGSQYLTEIELELLNDKLKCFEEAMLNQDYVLLADILEYEIKEVLSDYLNTITDFKMRIQDV